MDPREELEALRRMAELEARAGRVAPAARPIDPTDSMTGGEEFAAGMGRSAVASGRGLQQLQADSMAGPLAMADRGLRAVGATGVADTLARTVGAPVMGYRDGVQADVDEQARLDAALMATSAGRLGDATGAALQMAAPIPGGATARIAGMAGKAGKAARLGESVARGAAWGGAQATTGDESRLENAAMSGALSVPGHVIGAGIGRLAKGASDLVEPEARALMQKLRQAGIPLHVSQVLDSKALKTVASVLSYLPFSGAGAAGKAQQQAFNRTVSNSFDANAPKLTDAVMDAAKESFGRKYNAIFSGRPIVLDTPAAAKLQTFRAALPRRLSADERAVVEANIDHITQSAQGGRMTGDVYQSLRADMKGHAGKLGAVMGELRGVLDDIAFRSVGGQRAAALQQVNREYANFSTAKKALQQVAGAAGDVRPASLWGVIRQGSTQGMRTLAKAGQTVLKDPIPDSGTAARMAVLGAIGAAGAGGEYFDNPALQNLARAGLVGATAGRVMNSPKAASYLLEGAGPVMRTLLGGAARTAPALLPAAARSSPLELTIRGDRVATPAEIEADARRVQQFRGRR